MIACERCHILGRKTLADIICTSLDGPGGPGTGATMAFCVVHFWDWNVASLRRRGLHAVAEELEALVQNGELDQRPDDESTKAIDLRSVL